MDKLYNIETGVKKKELQPLFLLLPYCGLESVGKVTHLFF